MSATKAYVEQIVVRRRDQEAKDMDLRRKLTEHNILAGHGAAASRVEAKRRARSEAAERRELYMDFSYVTQQQEKAKRSQIAQFEEYLADELARRQAAQLRADMEKRRVCDGSEELRSLKERLHMAKVSKERAMQLVQKSHDAEQDRLHEHHIAEHMENERLEHVELEHKLNLEKNKQRERVKFINQQQITMKEQQKQEALAEYLREKEQVEELVNKIQQEDQEESEARHAKQEETKAALLKFRVEQKAQQEGLERAEREEFERIEAFAAQKRAQEQKLADEKAEQEREKVRVLNQMLGQMEAKNKEAEEFEQLRNDLHLEELEEESRRREHMQMRKRLEDKEDMKAAYKYQMKLKEDKLAKAREDEEQVREQLMKKFAEDDRIEQMNENKRRMRVEAHKREAERLLDLRREMYEQQREAEREHEASLRAEESKRQAIVEEERRRLIAEHGTELANFLPKGTLEHPDDWNLIRKRTPQTSRSMPPPSAGRMRPETRNTPPPSAGGRPQSGQRTPPTRNTPPPSAGGRPPSAGGYPSAGGRPPSGRRTPQTRTPPPFAVN